MAYTNSPLVSYTKISPNKTSNRKHAIDTITIHCTAGQGSVETLGSIFASPSRQASSNYGIGSDGRVGMYVEEKDRSWCSSNAENDHRAITIECASDPKAPYAVYDKVYATLINLLVDICKRNGIKKLVWSTNKDDRVNHRNGCNMTVHQDFANKDCPGWYLYSRHGQIANEVNARLVTLALDTKSRKDKVGNTYRFIAYNCERKPNIHVSDVSVVEVVYEGQDKRGFLFRARFKKPGIATIVATLGNQSASFPVEVTK